MRVTRLSVTAVAFAVFVLAVVVVSFVLVGTFVILNLFIAVVINNLETSKLEQLEELDKPTTHEDVLRELDRTREALRDLQAKIARLS